MPALPAGTWLEKEPSDLTDEERVRCRCLQDKRGLPAGDLIAQTEALNDHTATLTKGIVPSVDELETLKEYSNIAATEIFGTVKDTWFKKRSGHISISNTSCYEATRSEGGRRTYVLTQLRDWLMSVSSKSETIVLPTGESVILTEGLPLWMTVKPPGFDTPTEPPSGVKTSTGLLTEDFVYGEQERVGFQLLAWSFITLKDNGYLDSQGMPTGKPMPVTRIAVGEPGFKVRIATKSMAAFITYGQPFAHAMRELLESDPALRAGLGAGYQLHEWLKPFGTEHLPEYVMVGDFDKATDHIDHVAGRVAMLELLSVLNADNNNYCVGYVKALLSPRILEEDGDVIVTNTGCLMGEPGTKIVLTFLAKVANCYAHRGKSSKHFATAGDDQIDASDELDILKGYATASKITTMVPSIDKWGVFKYSLLYCQQLLDIRKTADNGELSIPKPRLLSPETKSGRGDMETNPAYGKAKQFAKEYSWSDFTNVKIPMIALFLRNMHTFIESGPQLFLPFEWGGLGLPGVEPSLVAERLPLWHQQLITAREKDNYDAKKILARWSTSRNFTRGLELTDDSIYRELIEEFLPTATMDQIDPFVPIGTRYRDKLKAAEREGWYPIDDILRKISDSQRYSSFWELETKVSRGYASLPWEERSNRMREASSQLLLNDVEIPIKPKWLYGKLVQTDIGVLHTTEGTGFGDSEEGELRHNVVSLIGTHASPRIFLHYDNSRLILNATSRPRYKRKRNSTSW
jgi:hypothetical protein